MDHLANFEMVLNKRYDDFTSLCRTNISQICESDDFWKNRVQRDFPGQYLKPISGKWINTYKEQMRRVNQSLIKATKRGDKNTIKELLHFGANPDFQNYDGITSLMFASGKGFNEIVELLIDEGADVDLQDKYGETALMMTAEKGLTLNEKISGEKENIEGKEKSARLLLNARANTAIENHEGYTAYEIAVEDGNKSIASLLWEFHNK